FIGWGSVILSLALERVYRNGIGTIVASMMGFVTLLIAHNLAADGKDTLEMMQAVLDTNFWLATHVTVINLGYTATFVAGKLGIIYIVLGIFTRRLSESAKSSTNPRVRAMSLANENIGQALGRM